MKTYETFITESIIDSLQKTYPSNIFTEDPKTGEVTMKDKVRDFIIKERLGAFSKRVKVKEFLMLGSTLTHRYRDDADIDINVLVDVPNDEFLELRKELASYNEVNVPGTKHPVNFFVTNDPKTYHGNLEKADAVFDIKKNEFVRVADESRPFDINMYMDAYRKRVKEIKALKDELKEDLIDFEEVKRLKKTDKQSIQKEIKKILDEIDEDAEGLKDEYENIRNARRVAFSEPLTAKEIKLYGSKNRLPENVVYKLLERYYWLNFLHKVEDALDEPKNKKIKELKKAASEKLKD